MTARSHRGPRRAPRRQEPPRDLDDIDYGILDLTQRAPDLTQAELAQKVGLSLSGLKRRLRRLEASRVIKGRVVLLDAEALDLDLLCFVQVTLVRHRPGAAREFRDTIRRLPEVLECHALTGEHDYLLKLVARDKRHLQQVLESDLAANAGVGRLQTSLSLEEVKATTVLPIAPAGRGRADPDGPSGDPSGDGTDHSTAPGV